MSFRIRVSPSIGTGFIPLISYGTALFYYMRTWSFITFRQGPCFGAIVSNIILSCGECVIVTL